MAQPGDSFRLAAGDLVERVLHPGGELVVDEAAPKCRSSRVTTANARKLGTSAVPFLNT
jgi:hypothetical protein